MPAARWEVDDKALTATLLDSRVGEHLRTAAQAGADYARTLAPVLTGRYRESLVALNSRQEGDEWVGGFGSDHWGWHWVEFGSVNNAPHRVLSNAARAVADRVEEL